MSQPDSLLAGSKFWEIGLRVERTRLVAFILTVGSWLAGSGESLQLIGKVLNHRDVSTTAIYARLNLDPVRQALERHATKMLEAAAPRGRRMSCRDQ